MPLHYVVPLKKIKSASPEIEGRKGEESLAGRGLLKWFNERIQNLLVRANLPAEALEEIRLRANQPLLLRFTGRDIFLNVLGEKVEPSQAYRASPEDLNEILERLTQSSLYAAEEEIRQGFLTLPGGHRVGVTGEAVLLHGRVQTLKHVTALNFRIANEAVASGRELLPYLFSPEGRFYHTLILSRPGAGKTTLLRSLIRLLSDGVPELKLRGQTVGVVDERGELAGMWQGVPAFDLGVRTDILDSCPKAVGMSMLIRAMAPQIVAVDELGLEEDVPAVMEALQCGVSVLSTAHASSLTEARARPSLERLLSMGVFERIILLSHREGPGTVERLEDLSSGHNLLERPPVGQRWGGEGLC